MVSKLLIICACMVASQAIAPVVYNSYEAQPLAYAASLGHVAPALRAAPVAHFSPANAVSHVYSSLAAPAALAYAPAHVAYSSPAIGSTHQNVVRSFDGTVSQHSKAVDTAFSSVRKYDTRINNKVYSPALAYAAPAPALYSPYASSGLYASAGPAYAAPIAHVTFDGYGIHYAY